MLERIDTWIGKTLFVPPIIRFCQLTRISQHFFHRVCWFAAALAAFAFVQGIFGKVAYGVFAVFMCLAASLLGDHYPTRSWRWFRLLVVAFAIYDIFRPRWLAYDGLVLFAEYASTIRTIPPLESGRLEQAYKRATVKG